MPVPTASVYVALYLLRFVAVAIHRGDRIRPGVHPAADTYAGATGGAAALEPPPPRVWAWRGVYSAHCSGLWGGVCAGVILRLCVSKRLLGL